MKLFKKYEKENLSHPIFLKLVKKWDAFLKKIKLDFGNTLTKTEQELKEDLKNNNQNTSILLNKLYDKTKRLYHFKQMIDQDFEKLFLKEKSIDINSKKIETQRNKAILISEFILEKIKHIECIYKGKIVEDYYHNTVFSDNLDAQKINELISYKNTSSSSLILNLEKNTKTQKAINFYWAIDCIAKYKALEEWESLQKLKNELESKHPLSHESFKKIERVKRNYWTKYFLEITKFLPQYTELIDYEVDVKMKSFYQKRKTLLNF